MMSLVNSARRPAAAAIMLWAAGAVSASAAPPVKLTVKAVEGSGGTFTSRRSTRCWAGRRS